MSPLGLRERRIANEWRYLQALAEQNPALLTISGRRCEPAGECFDFTLGGTPAYAGLPLAAHVRDRHVVRLRFPEFYPAVPCEAFLEEVVFHPNVHPRNGFVCLWDSFSPGDSVLEAVPQLQRVVCWHLYNASAEHVMQPEALALAAQAKPLGYRPVTVPEELARERAFRQLPKATRRARLS